MNKFKIGDLVCCFPWHGKACIGTIVKHNPKGKYVRVAHQEEPCIRYSIFPINRILIYSELSKLEKVIHGIVE